jgi:hypothetical protein
MMYLLDSARELAQSTPNRKLVVKTTSFRQASSAQSSDRWRAGIKRRAKQTAGHIMQGMDVTIKVSEKLAAEARARGVSVEVYVQELLARKAIEAESEQRLQSVNAAIERIQTLRKGNRLAGLKTKDLIHEGHKY